MTKRRLISLLPAWNRTNDLTAFFGATVDELFQPGTSDSVSGYIGHKLGGNANDFYVEEPSQERTAYQLESGMVSLDSTGNVSLSLTYADLVNALAADGAVTSNHDRLFDTEYYSWAPPINLDALVNYIQYYWFGLTDGIDGGAELPTLKLSVPIAIYQGDGRTNTFALPSSINGISEQPGVYVAGEPANFSVVGDHVVLSQPPSSGDVVVVARTPDLIAAITGNLTVDVSGLTQSMVFRGKEYSVPEDSTVAALSSGMRIQVFDAVTMVGDWDDQPWDDLEWDFSADTIFMVDGVGQSIRLTPEAVLIRDIGPQFITIDRSSAITNSWSIRNCWVHKGSYAWAIPVFAAFGMAFPDFSARRAARPIIEFNRDLVMYPGQVWQQSAEPRFMLYDLNGKPLSEYNQNTFDTTVNPDGSVGGNRIFGYVHGDPIGKDTLLGFAPSYDVNGYYLFNNDGAAVYVYENGVISSLYCYATTSTGNLEDASYHSLWQPVDGTTNQTVDDNGFYRTPLNLQANPLAQEVGNISRSTWIDHFPSLMRNQDNFSGNPHGSNNYRDTARDASSAFVQFTLTQNDLISVTASAATATLVFGVEDVAAHELKVGQTIQFTGMSVNNTTFTIRSIAGNSVIVSPPPIDQTATSNFSVVVTGQAAIFQHRAPLLRTMLLCAETAYNLPQAIRFTEQEYNRFRNKFARKIVELRNKGTLADSDPASLWVTTALKSMRRDKNSSFPFGLNRIGGDQYFIPPTPTMLGILPSAVPTLITDTTYGTSVTMILGHDGSLTPAFNDWRDPMMLELETFIYSSLSEFAFLSRVYPTIATTDRDNIAAQFAAAAISEVSPEFDIRQWISNPFRTIQNGYARSEISAMLSPMFERWAQINHFDYRTNKSYDPTDPFTWNFNGVLDRFGNPLPGSWRAIYRLYFGTDAPHTRPWEMLGFASEPSWWSATYGAAPYGRNNTNLWGDLEAGRIASGPRAGNDPIYARPGLIDLIPVDAHGNLLNPIDAGIVLTTVTRETGARSWQSGDHGPVENLWISSPSYRFALAIVGFLMKPARFVELCWDTVNTGYHGAQWVDLNTLNRPQTAQATVHGEDDANPVIGISQWISDYLISVSQSVSNFGNAVRGLDVRLLHQMAGFTSSTTLQAVSDSFGLLPSEDVQVILYSSPTIDTEVYSGVIIEWTGRSYRVIGYDTRNPVFTIIPGDQNGPKGAISLDDTPQPKIVPWRRNTYYPVGILVFIDGKSTANGFINSVFQCTRSHTSGSLFEQEYWTARPDLSETVERSPRVITYLAGLDSAQQIPYGTEFFNNQDVADFLLGWQRWLVGRGWLFDTIDTNTGVLRDWYLSVKEFLAWTQVEWAPGNFIALSPGMQQLKYSTEFGTILNVENNLTGFFGLIDRSGQPIGPRDAVINRLDGDISLVAKNADIFAARLEISEFEHVLVFSNTTVFNDHIYLPLFNQRQGRLRLICNRASDWQGRLDAPGFVISGNQIKSDFEKAAEDVRLAFDIEQIDRTELRDYARHVIGFQPRSYLNKLLINDIEQFEFYQGMISQKGAPGVFQKLMRSNRASNNSDLRFVEEWGIRLGSFGAPGDPFITFLLAQSETRGDPQIVRFTSTAGAPPDWIVLASPSDPRWVDRPAVSQFFPSQPTPTISFPSAGSVRLDEVDFTAFSLNDLAAVFQNTLDNGQTPFPIGSLCWVYERTDGTFAVLRSFDAGSSGNQILQVTSNNEDAAVQTTRIVLQQPMTLSPADIGNYLVIDGSSLSVPELNGMQVITDVNVAANTIDLQTISTQGNDFTAQPSTAPFVRVLRDVRFTNAQALTAANLPFVPDDLVWLDTGASGGWEVWQWSGFNWITIRKQPVRVDPRMISETVIYRMGSMIAFNQMIDNEPLVPVVTVIDPLSGLIAGTADREIEYKTETDPALYNTGMYGVSGNPWGPNQIGRVWWNLATTKFLDTYMDQLGVTPERDIAELTYRRNNWAQIAPGSSIDIYEWVESRVDPLSYTSQGLPGTVFNSNAPSWCERSKYDPISGREITYYYFWVSSLTTVPDVPFRTLDISSVALAVANPSSLGLPWMAAISSDALIVSGVTQFLGDNTTAMKLRLTLDQDKPDPHEQWLLMRPGDETSIPPQIIWTHLRDSLSGFDNQLHPVPDKRLAAFRQIGTHRGEAMFAVDSSDGERTGLMRARRAFVQSVNRIFAATPIAVERANLIANLHRVDTSSLYLLWTQIDQSYAFVPPPDNEWDVQVFTLSERNNLLMRADFQTAISTGSQIRVLMNGIGNTISQWSIWVFDGAVAAATLATNAHLPTDQQQSNEHVLLDHADGIFQLATAYNPNYVVSDVASLPELTSHIVADIAANTNLGKTTDTRVLVNDGVNFWSIWRYDPTSPNADENGFALWRTQMFNTSDFYTMVDWYAEGYSASNPPVIVYGSAAERDSTEGSAPINQLVKVMSTDLTHPWIWTLYVPSSDTSLGGWETVAIANGTVQLDGRFYDDPSRPVHGFNQLANWDMDTWDNGNWSGIKQIPNITDVARRDGSWEIRVIADVLRWSTLLLDTEINQLFFDMLNFVHAQQNDVDWAFKTSFMNVIGYNVPLTATPYQPSDQTANLLDYINEVKPYHVKVRETMTQYQPSQEYAYVTKSEIEHTRLFDITMLFDRTVGNAAAVSWGMKWDNQSWSPGEAQSGGAAARILSINSAADLASVLNLDFKGTWLDGYILKEFGISVSDFGVDGFDTEGFDTIISSDIQDVYDGVTLSANTPTVDINPALPSRPGGYDLRAPYYAPDHPEERVPFGADDGLHMTITASALAGGPPQIARTFEVSGYTIETATLFFGLIAQSSAAVLVYRDGVRAVLNTDYTVDHFAQTVTVDLIVGGNRVSIITIHAFGFGGTSVINDAEFLSYQTNTVTLNETVDPTSLLVTVNGATASFTASSNSISLSDSYASGSDVAVVWFAGGADTASMIQQQTLSYQSPQQWTLTSYDAATTPEHAGTIVEVNGERLAPPPTFYGVFDSETSYMHLPRFPQNGDTVTIYANGVLYTQTIPSCTTTDESSTYPFHLVVPDGQTPPTNISGQFVYFGSLLVALDPSFVGSVAVVIQPSGTQADYTVSNHILTINKSLNNGDSILVTTFSNAGAMGLRTVSYATAGTDYPIPTPFNKNYTMVWMDGLLLAPDVDYVIDSEDGAWDEDAWDIDPYDLAYNASLLRIFNPTSGNVVATIGTAPAAREEMQWMVNTITPAAQRMSPAILDGKQITGLPTNQAPVAGVVAQYRWGTDTWDNIPWDARPLLGKAQPLYHANLGYIALFDSMAGTLSTPLGSDDFAFSIDLFLRNIAPKLQPEQPFVIPDKTKPGIVWIGSERIEYFGLSRNGDSITFYNLRRRTSGTSIAEQRIVQTATSDGAQHSYTFHNAIGTVEVIVNDVPWTQDKFTLTTNGSDTVVTLTAPSLQYITIAVTIGDTYPIGTAVYSGDNRLTAPVPVGADAGNRELVPMQQIVAS